MVILSLMMLSPLLWAEDKPNIPKTTVLEETGDVLTLRGIALHKRFFEDSYLGAFYSVNPLHDPQEALEDTGPKRMWFYLLRNSDNSKQGDFKIYWSDAIHDNNPPEIISREQINISQFISFFNTPLKKGDIVVLDYIPNIGTKVIINGALRGTIKGNEFYDLILKIWMGRQPPSEKFRKELFNLS